MPRQDVWSRDLRCGKQGTQFLRDLPARSRQWSWIAQRIPRAIITANACYSRDLDLHRPPGIRSHPERAAQHDGGTPFAHAIEEKIPAADVDQPTARRITSRLAALRYSLVNKAEGQPRNCETAEDGRAGLQYTSNPPHLRNSKSEHDRRCYS